VPSIAQLSQHFPQWEVLDEIGRGGMGAVYRVRQPALDRIVALKILPPEVAADPAFAERFTREAQTLARLNHPHIVTVHEAGTVDGLYYLLMEYVDGVNLRVAIRNATLNPAAALQVISQICSGLQYAHDHGVVHRDIKPENILLDRAGRVKIADFGLAKMVRGNREHVSLTETHQVLGTWHYMAPEQLEQPLGVDHRADIYALGVVFYELLTGELPLGHFKPPSQRGSSDTRLDEVVLKALEPTPGQRYQRADDLSGAVSEILSTPPAPAPTPSGPITDAAPPNKPAAAEPLYPAPAAATATAPRKDPPDAYGQPPQQYAATDPRPAPFRPGPTFHIGNLLFAAAMLALGGTLLWMHIDANNALFWIGLGLTITGLGTATGAGGEQQTQLNWTPELGQLVSGGLFLALAIWMLMAENFEPDLFTWVGIGLSFAGAGMIASAWSGDAPRRPWDQPRLDRVVFASGLSLLGGLLMFASPLGDPDQLTWIGMGLYLAGAGSFQSVWSDAETGPAERHG
jgi:predicted Ser/Thr protein kinase